MTDFTYTGSAQVFTVPQSGYYHIVAYGAAGGSNSNHHYAGGLGASASGDIFLQAGAALEIIVGGAGQDNGGLAGAGGGGGSFVIETNDGTHDVNVFEIVAGGGGGAGSIGAGGAGQAHPHGADGGGSVGHGFGGAGGQGGTGAPRGGGGGGFTGGNGGRPGTNGLTLGTTFAGGIGVSGGAGGGFGGGGGGGGFSGGGGGGGWGGGGAGGYSKSSGGGGGGSYGDPGVKFKVFTAGVRLGNGFVSLDLDPQALTTSNGVTAAPEQTATAVDGALTLVDVTGATLASATVTISSHFHSAEDSLAFLNTSSVTFGDIAGSYDPIKGVLSLTSASGTATLAQWQAALDAVTYTDTSDTPDTSTRTVSFQATDSLSTALAATKDISVTPVNDPPIVSGDVTLSPIAVNSGAHLITQADLLAKASDIEGDVLTAVGLTIAKGQGTLVDNHDGTWSYTPKLNDDTGVTFAYQVSDGHAATAAGATLDILASQFAPQLGTPGPDVFTAPTGNAQFDALGGVDTINFTFRLVDAVVTYSGNQIIIDGPSSHTVLIGFEIFKFTDGTVNNADNDRLVDDLFYYSQNHDVWTAGVDADTHYHTFGWREGRDPDAFFSTSTYLSENPSLKASGTDPLIWFDQGAWKNGIDPSINFDIAAYLKAYPDVKAAGTDPLAHFLTNGYEEGRLPPAPSVLLAANGFDYVYYLQHNPDVAAAHVDPLQHYVTIGWREGRNPNALFDDSGYLAAYADVKAAGIDPLDHYNNVGWKEGRDPSTNFDTKAYLAHYPDVAAAHVNPLTHFLQFGQLEGRSSFADGHFG
jgi:hypothetical protein